MKINYGIYIGTSSASIAKMEAGEPVVIRSIDKLKYTTPIAVAINKKGNLFVGDKAYDAWKSDSFKKSGNQNSFIEFTRTLGTDKKYFSSNANRSFSSEELLAEAFKHQDEGNLSAEYLEEVKQKYLALIKPEHMAEVKMIMSQYGI